MTPESVPEELTEILGAQIVSEARKLSMSHPYVLPHPAFGIGREYCYLTMAVLLRTARMKVGQTQANNWSTHLLSNVWFQCPPMIRGEGLVFFLEDFHKRMEVYWKLPREESIPYRYELPDLMVGSCMGFYVWMAHVACTKSTYPMNLEVLMGGRPMSLQDSRNLPERSFAFRTYKDALLPMKRVQNKLEVYFICPELYTTIQAPPPLTVTDGSTASGAGGIGSTEANVRDEINGVEIPVSGRSASPVLKDYLCYDNKNATLPSLNEAVGKDQATYSHSEALSPLTRIGGWLWTLAGLLGILWVWENEGMGDAMLCSIIWLPITLFFLSNEFRVGGSDGNAEPRVNPFDGGE